MKWSTAILMGGGLVVMFGFMGWAFYSTRAIGFGPGGGAITVMIVAGVLGTGLLTGVLMWLAFYSSRKGYDESPTFETKSDASRDE
jgi:cation transporter-like permease